MEGVSQRLVGLSKDQGSADNISVVVVFLAEPSEVIRRRHMETASPNPFLKQNGSELFCGTPTNGKLHPCSGPFHDEDDFGPETDVDMVDDVLLSPTLAAAKKLVAEKSEFENDLERQRHQMSDFDDPADLDRSRDTPTPPAHEVVGNVDENIAAESGEGEESDEEEWNYFCGSTQNNKNTSDNTDQDSDMTSQLNPNAAEFVPVSPSRFMIDPDPVISSSPRHGFEKSLQNVTLPSQEEFNLDIAHKPGELDSSGTESRVWSENITENEDTQLTKSEEISTNAEYGDNSTLNLEASANNSTEPVHGKPSCDVTHNELDSFDNKNMEYINTFGSQNVDSFKDLELYPNAEVKNFHQPTEVGSDYRVPQETENIVPDTPKSTAVEAPVSPLDMQTDIDSPDDNQHNQKSPELISPSDGHLEGLSVQEPTSSSGFESESGADEPETHISDDLKHNEGDGFTIEHRKSPPIQPVHFKPIHTFSDTNPFDILDDLTSPSTEKESSITDTNVDKLNTDLLVDIIQDASTKDNLQNPKDNFEIGTRLQENSLSPFPTEEYNSANEKYHQTQTSIFSESHGIDECKEIEKIITKDDSLLTGQSVFSSNIAEAEDTSLISGNSTCSFQSKDANLGSSESAESKFAAGTEMEGEEKLKGNIFNSIAGLEFETSKQEFDDNVSDIIFGSRDTELPFESGKPCEIDSVINSSEHQIHNFEDIQFDTSKSNNKLESKYLDIHFGTDDIEFETDYNDYSVTNKNDEKSVPCKEETENNMIDEERKLVDIIDKNDRDMEKIKASNIIQPVEFSIDSVSSECNNMTQNVDITESVVNCVKDPIESSSKECIQTSVSSVAEQLLNESEKTVIELCENQIVTGKIAATNDFDDSDIFSSVQDVQRKVITEIHENDETRQLGEEIHKNILFDEMGKEVDNNVETEICSDVVKEVETNSILFAQSELTPLPLNIVASDQVEEPVSFKTETNNSVNLDEIKGVNSFETPVSAGAELVQTIIPEIKSEIISEVLSNNNVQAVSELSEIIQNEPSSIVDNKEGIKENDNVVEVVTNLISTTKVDAMENNQNSNLFKFNITEVQEFSEIESETPKPLHFDESTSTVSEVVIPTLHETCVMPVPELGVPQASSDRANETQLLLQSEPAEEVLQTEETGEMLSITGTPPPTPAPGILEEEVERKEGLLAAAAAAAGVATVAAAIASDPKQTQKKLAATSKKPVTATSKKPLDVGTKTTVKPSLKTAGSPSKPATSKPSPQTSVTKKPTTTGASKTTKPAVPDVKTTPTALKSGPPKPTTPTSRTTTTTSKPSTTPHSKPATPTSRPVSANKTDISKSALSKTTPPAKTTAAKSTKPAAGTVKMVEKKPLTNGEVSKPAAKKMEHSETKKLPLSVTSNKPATTVGRITSTASKPPVTKVSSTAVKSAVASKTSTTPPVQSKPKPPATNSVKQTTKPNTSTLVAKNRPPSASAVLKPTDKTGKDTVNKQISSAKTSAVSKVPAGNKITLKTESKVSSKIDTTKLESKDQVKKSTGTNNQDLHKNIL